MAECAASERSGEETGDLLRGTSYAGERVQVFGADVRAGGHKIPGLLTALADAQPPARPVLQSLGSIHAHHTP